MDGVLVHYNRSCHPRSPQIAQTHRPLSNGPDRPLPRLHRDQADPRNFNEAQYATRVQGLVEAMEANQAKKEAEAK